MQLSGGGTRLAGNRGRGVAITIAVAIGLLASPLTAAAVAADNSPVAEWHMDEIDPNGDFPSTTPDSSGNGNDLKISGATQVPGRWGNAFSFSAATADELYDGVPEPSLSPPQLTVMAWVKGTNPGAYKYLVAKGGTAACGGASYALYTGGNAGAQFYVWDGTGSAAFSPEAGPGIWDGQWHAIAGTFDGSTVRLYVDGTEVGTGTPTNQTINYGLDATGFTIGNYPYGPCTGFSYTGSIDEVRIYDRALTASEINQLQTATGNTPPELSGTTTTTTTGTTTIPPPPPPPPPSGRPVAKFVLTGPSRTMKGAAWFNGALSTASAGHPIVSYAWDPTGTGHYSDPCGSAPIASMVFGSRGVHTVGLQVTDSTGAVSTYRQTVDVTSSMVGKVLGAGYTYDCENPAGGGDEPSTADCIKTFAWSIIDVNSRGGTDDCFKVTSRIRPGSGRVVIPARAEARPAVNIREALYTYHATVTGPVAINGLYVPIPHAVTTIYDTGDGTIGLGSVPIRIGPFGTQTLNLNFHIALQNLPVSDCYSHTTQGFRLVDSGAVKQGTTINGLPIQGGIGVDLLDHSSRITLNVGLPNVFGFGPGQPAQGTLCLNLDNTNGLSLDGVKIGPIPNAWIGPISLNNLTFHYVQDDNLWEGGATVTFPGSPVSIDASPPPPDLGFGIKNGSFDHGGIGVDFGAGAQPEVFPGVFLTNIHVALGTDPLRFTGGIGLNAAQILQINGDAFIAFASPSQPYDFPTTGGDLAPLSGRTLNSFTLAVGGTASAKLPILGQSVQLANAYVLYEYPDYFELGGGFEFDPPLLKITGSMLGFLDPSQHAFNLQGSVAACLKDVTVTVPLVGNEVNVSPCFTTGAVVSSKGIAFCGTIPVPAPVVGVVPLPLTVGYKWGDSAPTIIPLSCQMSDYEVASTHAAAAAAPPGFSLGAGLSVATVRITGSGGAPDVVLSGPGGEQVSTDGKMGSANDVVIHIAAADETLIGLKQPQAGRWTVSQAPGSVPITSVAVAKSVPAPAIHVMVSGRGQRRALLYRLVAAPGRSIAFVERGPGVYHQLGVARGTHGTITFTPAAGQAGRRQILALISQGGVPASQTVVGSYRAAAAPRLSAVRGLRVARVGSRLVVSWAGVPSAWRYSTEVMLNTGRRELLLSRGPRVTFAGMEPSVGGHVVVVAISADAGRGRPAGASFAAVRSRAGHRGHRAGKQSTA